VWFSNGLTPWSASWREVYSTWFPQKTQEDARRLSEIIDKKKAGTRKYYESTWMKNALAGAAIVALAGDQSGQAAVLKAVSHYDYAKLNMAEFFFAEVAYYALPEVK
jgi:5,10-methylenetetrahydrofolate reductase